MSREITVCSSVSRSLLLKYMCKIGLKTPAGANSMIGSKEISQEGSTFAPAYHNMKVAKRFRWEGAHRLPWHTGGCQNLHGHSYHMWVELKAGTVPGGMVMDFKSIKKVLQPLLDAWDHATLVSVDDVQLLKAIDLLQTKHYILPYDTTSENICLYITEYLAVHALSILEANGIEAVEVRLQETETCFAAYEVTVAQMKANLPQINLTELLKCTN
jgi:6-pyruvoyltetrahydropterin/6-carboxytetrahydropterin synthase